jgi:ATP-dependent DNA helicase 2 subunit 1
MALEEEVPELSKADDKTIPKYRQIDKRVREYVIQFGEAFDKEYPIQARTLQSSSAKPKKRATPADADADDVKPMKLAKRVKTESQATVDSAGITDNDMAALNDKGALSRVSCYLHEWFEMYRANDLASNRLLHSKSS